MSLPFDRIRVVLDRSDFPFIYTPWPGVGMLPEYDILAPP